MYTFSVLHFWVNDHIKGSNTEQHVAKNVPESYCLHPHFVENSLQWSDSGKFLGNNTWNSLPSCKDSFDISQHKTLWFMSWWRLIFFFFFQCAQLGRAPNLFCNSAASFPGWKHWGGWAASLHVPQSYTIIKQERRAFWLWKAQEAGGFWVPTPARRQSRYLRDPHSFAWGGGVCVTKRGRQGGWEGEGGGLRVHLQRSHRPLIWEHPFTKSSSCASPP